jgi:hypothetical protein
MILHMKNSAISHDGLHEGHAVPAFNYNELPDDVVKEAREFAAKIKTRMRSTIESISQAGKCLRLVKERLEHGTFSAWVNAECKLGIRSAEDLMRISVMWDKNIVNLETPPLISLTVWSCLASKSACPEEVALIIGEAGRGVYLAVEDVRGRLNAARERAGTTDLRHGTKGRSKQGTVLEGVAEPPAEITALAPISGTAVGDDVQAHLDHAGAEAEMVDHARGPMRARPSERKLESDYRADHAGRVLSPSDDTETRELNADDASGQEVIALFERAADRIVRKGMATRKQLLDPANRKAIDAIFWATMMSPEEWPTKASMGMSTPDSQHIGGKA